MIKILIALLSCLLAILNLNGQESATVKESNEKYTTYPFSDPNPIPNPQRSIFPYFGYDGFTLESVEQDWKVVTLENNYIKVYISPEIGGKVLGAIEKSTGREFIYYNSVVKFRDIAMRGPWTSGGIEFNFGLIGHVPTTSNPVDYITKENEDGSVSCIVGANELMTRARWEVEIRVPKDKAYFTTSTTYHNPTSLEQPYYQWHNAAYQAEGDLEYCFPGDVRLSHGGEARSWPIDEEGRNLSWYKNNAFGGSKSDHIIGSTKGYYASYWHAHDFGSGHYSTYGDKLGRKIFSWAQSRSGGIWEDLLTDNDGQYVEMQSGKTANQAGSNSMWTPFKHVGFSPYKTDIFTEYWYPILSTGGVVESNPFGTLNVEKNGNNRTISFCPLEKSEDEIKVFIGNKLQESYKVNLSPLQTWSATFSIKDNSESLKIIIGNKKIVYSEKQESLKRPVEIPKEYNWDSLYGLYTEGLNWMYQGQYEKAMLKFQECLKIDSFYAPALNQIAELYYRKGELNEALSIAQKSLSLDTYDSKANFIYGLINKELGNINDAIDGFSVATTFSSAFKNSAYIELAKLYLLEDDLHNASLNALKVLSRDVKNIEAIQIMTVINRMKGNYDVADDYLTKPFTEKELIDAIESRLLKTETLLNAFQKGSSQNDEEGDIRNLNELKSFFEEVGEKIELKNGEYVYEIGDRSNNIYLVTKGVVKSFKIDSNGKELITELVNEDNFLGFTPLQNHSPYMESAMVVKDAEMYAITKSILRELLGKNQNISIELMNVITDSVHKVKEQLLQMAYSSVRRKTAQTLLHFADTVASDSEQPSIRVSRSDLASVAGIATESLIRMLSNFKKEALIDIDGREIIILNKESLESIE